MLMMLGDFDFHLIVDLTGGLGVTLFMFFMMVTFMTLANITIAVICNRWVSILPTVPPFSLCMSHPHTT
jgi:hypothetical protein